MSVSLESFLNFCESSITCTISWLGNARAQEQEWDRMSPDFLAVQVTVERFLEECEEIFELDYFKHYADFPTFVLLKDLYIKIKTYDSDPKLMFNFYSKEKLLKDPMWIEIQSLALKTKISLEKFIKENRKNAS